MNVKCIFGPVPSRRLGQSIGINNIPPKICSYSCAYCQIGFSLKMSIERRFFYDPEKLLKEVEEKINECCKTDEVIDYLTIVPDGEPTLDQNLGHLLRLLKTTGLKTAVITNSTLLSRPDVRADLCEADWVSVKVDSVNEEIWRKIDHPHRELALPDILEGIKVFTRDFGGFLATETMLAEGINDGAESARENGAFIAQLKPSMSYLSIPTRPPADSRIKQPSEESLNTIYQIYSDTGIQTEYLIGYEGNDFACSGNIEDDILSITSVHPMKEEAVLEYLKKAGATMESFKSLIAEEKLSASEYNGERYYIRKFKNRTT